MRVAIVSDIHGNRTAFEAVLADLRDTSPDLILHGGDLADSGSSPVEILDRICDLGWPGVYGNTDEMLFRPESLARFASRLPQLGAMFDKIGEMAAWTREKLGDRRVAVLGALPKTSGQGAIGLTHATPESTWQTVMPEADGIESIYASLGQPIVVYGHIHRPYVRKLSTYTIANSGSVGQPHDGDPRASYLLIDDTGTQIRRVAYDVGKEIKALKESGLPHADWVAKILETARPQAP